MGMPYLAGKARRFRPLRDRLDHPFFDYFAVSLHKAKGNPVGLSSAPSYPLPREQSFIGGATRQRAALKRGKELCGRPITVSFDEVIEEVRSGEPAMPLSVEHPNFGTS